MYKILRRIRVVIVLSLLLGSVAHAQREQIFVGTRPLSMGEAFVAVADDGNAIYWNPAGLATMERIQASFNYADLFGLGINSYYASFISRLYFVPPLTDYLSFGVDWFGIQTGDDELTFNRNQFDFALAIKPPRRWPIIRDLSLGLSTKYLTFRAELDGTKAAQASGWGFDFGILYNLGALQYLPKGLYVGIMIHDLGGTQVSHETGVNEEVLPQSVRWGLSYRPLEAWGDFPISDPVLALDFDDRVHFGLEFWLERVLAIRMGIQKDLHTDEKVTLSFGLGLRLATKTLPELNVDYALTDSPLLPNTNKQFGGSLILRDDPRLIRFENVQINDIFSSLYKHYASEAGEFGKAVIRNIYDDTLSVEVSFKSRPFIRDPIPETAKVPPRGIAEVPLRAILDERIIEVTSRERGTGQIEAVYTLPGRGRFRTTQDVSYTLYGRGAITWDDPGKAAAFVTMTDKCINEFAESVVGQQLPETRPITFFTRSVDYALHLYEAMRALGFKWVRDPTTPYYKVGQTQQVVDQIDYPAELLASRSKAGDCDDLSVLYATLLESVGVNTAFLSTPTHLFMMFNTEIPARKLNSIPIDTTRFLSYQGMLWMPIETTAFPSSFFEAWNEGANRCQYALVNDSLEIVGVELNQQDNRYPPASMFYADACTVKAPNVTDAARAGLNSFVEASDSYLQMFEDGLQANPDDIVLRNRYAAILGQNGERNIARKHLQYVLEKDPTNSTALNNLSNIEFIEGNFVAAESLYIAANKHNPYDKAGTYLNLAFLYEIMGIVSEDEEDKEISKEKSISALTEASHWLNNDSDLALYLLGLPDFGIAGKGDEQKVETAAPDTTQDTSQDTTTTGVAERPSSADQPPQGWFISKARAFAKFIKTALKTIAEGRSLNEKQIGLEPAGAKGERLVDVDRAWLLWWSS